MLADVAGYSRMMERDESGTHLRLREVRTSVTDPAITRHHGRIVRNKGDDILVEFASAVEALSCAVEIQRAMSERNRDLTPDSRIEFRIGINLGDILIDGGEIAGDGVNVAARLEALAEPGEIAISQAVREQVRQLVGVRLVDAGQHKVKNISRPIRVFKVSRDGRRSAGALSTALRRLRSPVATLGLLLLITAGALFSWQQFGRGAAAAPRESVAVLPTVSAAGAGAVGEALAGQLSSALAQSLVGTVVAPSTAARIAERSPDPRDIGRQLKVRYVVETNAALQGPRVQVDARLVATDNGAQLWSSRLEADLRAGEGVPLEIIGRLTGTLTSEVRRVELARAQTANEPPDAYLLSLRAANDLPNATTPEAMDAVRKMFLRATELDPNDASALAGLAGTLAYQAVDASHADQRPELLAQADAISLQAVAAGPNLAAAWLVRSKVLGYRGELAAAQQALERALKLNPFEDEAHLQYGRLLVAAGDPAKAVEAFDRALRLNPEGPLVGVYLYDRCRALLLLGHYPQAIESCTRAMAFTPDWPDFMLLAAAYAQAGDTPRAAQARDELLRRRPSFSISWLRSDRGAMTETALRQREAHLIAGLQRAGVPE